MSLKIVLVFSQGFGVGKSTFADLLMVKHAYAKAAFAHTLKKMVTEVIKDALTLNEQEAEFLVYGVGKKTELGHPFLPGVTARTLQQKLGTEWREMVAPDLWSFAMVGRIKALKKDWDLLDAGPLRLVIDDFRFDREFEVLVAAFGREAISVVEVIRPGAGGSDGHKSEGGVTIHPDWTISNEGTLEDLAQATALFEAEA